MLCASVLKPLRFDLLFYLSTLHGLNVMQGSVGLGLGFVLLISDSN